MNCLLFLNPFLSFLFLLMAQSLTGKLYHDTVENGPIHAPEGCFSLVFLSWKDSFYACLNPGHRQYSHFNFDDLVFFS